MTNREENMVTLRRDRDGRPTVWCDPEIVDLVDALNNGSLATVASCSGHGEKPGFIALADGRVLMLYSSLEPAEVSLSRPTPSDAGLREALDAAWEAYQSTPVDLCADSDDETRRCVENAVIAALQSSPSLDGDQEKQ